MRPIAALIALISLVFFVPQAGPAAKAQEACQCKGCGCKGGPGWRSPEGTCIAQTELAEICGSPPGAPCVKEAATRICYGGKSASVEAEPQTE